MFKTLAIKNNQLEDIATAIGLYSQPFVDMHSHFQVLYKTLLFWNGRTPRLAILDGLEELWWSIRVVSIGGKYHHTVLEIYTLVYK